MCIFVCVVQHMIVRLEPNLELYPTSEEEMCVVLKENYSSCYHQITVDLFLYTSGLETWFLHFYPLSICVHSVRTKAIASQGKLADNNAYFIIALRKDM